MNIIDALVAINPFYAWSLNGEPIYANLVWLDEEHEKPTLAVLEAKIAELEAAEPLRVLRQQRNKLLTETDWWAVSDRTMTDEERTYRQALRDLPANTADPANPVWPVKPS